MSQKVFDAVSSQITDIIENNNELPWAKPWVVQKLADQYNGISKRPYSGLNALVLSVLGNYDSPYWLTFKQGTSLGFVLPKGSKGVRVISWFKPERVDPKTGEVEESSRLACRFNVVFNFEQWVVPEGVTVPKHFLEKPVKQLFNNPRFDLAEDLILSTGAKIRDNGQHACYIPLRDEIIVPNIGSFTGSHEYYSTVFHELGHWTGHESRLNRFKTVETGRLDNSEYSREELVAELCSAFVCGLLDISTESSLRNSAAYIKGWWKFIKSDSKAFVVACQRAQKAADLVAKKLPEIREAYQERIDEAVRDYPSESEIVSHETAYFDLGNEMDGGCPF